MKNTRMFVWLSVIFSVFTWGSNFNIMAFLSISPMTGSAVRFGVAALILLVMRGYRRQAESCLSTRQKCQLLLLGLIGIFGQNLALFIGMKSTSAFNGALIVCTSPVAAMIFSSLLLGTKINSGQIAGVLLSLAGVSLVITNGDWEGVQFASGDIYIFLGMLCGALFTILSKKWASDIPVTQTSRWSIVSGSLLLILLAAVYEQPLEQLATQSSIDLLLLLYMGLFSTVIAYRYWMIGAVTLGPANIMACFNLMPVFTLLISLCLGYLPSLLQLSGVVLVSLGVFLSCKLIAVPGKEQREKALREEKLA